MSVSNGQAGDAPTFNGGFLSRLSDSTTVAIVGLDNADPDSGKTIANTQQAINNKTYEVYTTQSMSGSGTIIMNETEGQQYRPVVGNGGAVTLSNTPFGTDTPINGAIMEIQGTDDANTVRINHNDAAKGCIINGAFVVLKQWQSIKFTYIAEFDRWKESGRNF